MTQENTSNNDTGVWNNVITALPEKEIFEAIMALAQPLDFRTLSKLPDKEKLRYHDYLVGVINEIIRLSQYVRYGLTYHNGCIYVFNKMYWSRIREKTFKDFLGRAAQKMGAGYAIAQHFKFKDNLYDQFISASDHPNSDLPKKSVLISLKNGTFDVGLESQFLREPRDEDFLTYQLPFKFDKDATCPMFIEFINKVLPDGELQAVLAEFIGSLFISTKQLKLEKALLLYGDGANGKSVVFEIVNALLGRENVSNFPLQNLTDKDGYYRAMMANKLLNYSSEINNKMDRALFKQLVSGEPVPARLPYKPPFTIEDYAKLIFNTNELPKDVETTNAYFRRLLIIPFLVTIPDGQQDKELAKKIIQSELSGIFNWVLEGVKRLLKNKSFTYSEIINNAVNEYKKQSDPVLLFIEEIELKKSLDKHITLASLTQEYKKFSTELGFRSINNGALSTRLKKIGFEIIRRGDGNVVYATKKMF